MRVFTFGLLLLLGLALPASAQLHLYPPTSTTSAVTVATANATSASATDGGAGVNLTIAVGFSHGIITDCTWEAVSNASVNSVAIEQFSDSARSNSIGWLAGGSGSGVAATVPLPTFTAMGSRITYAAVHDSEDANLYLKVYNKTGGGQDGTVKVTCTVLRDS